MKHSDEFHGRHFDLKLLWRFLPFIRPYRRSALYGFALLPFISLLRVVPPLLIKEAIDNNIVPGNLAGLLPIAATLIGLLLVEGALVYWQALNVQLVGQRIMADLRRDGFAKLMRVPRSWYDWQPAGRLLTRLTTDIEQVGDLFGSGIVSAIGDVATLLLIFAIMLSINTPLSLVAFAVVPVLVVAILLIRRPMRTVMRQLRSRLAALNAFVSERVSGIAEVQIFGQQQPTIDAFETLQRQYQRSALSWVSYEAVFYASVHIFGSLAVAAILWKGGGEVMHNTATFGTLVAFIEYSRKFFMPLTDLASKFSVLQSSNSALERIYELLDQPEEDGGSVRTVPPLAAAARGGARLRFEQVNFAYQPEEPILNGLSFEVQPGQCVALVGDTGSGKSTLAQLLLGFYPLQHGEIFINDTAISTLDKVVLRQQVGWVSQEPFLFCGSVHDNLDPQRRLSEEALWQQLEKTAVAQVVRQLGGLKGLLAEQGKNISSGERQLLCLARAQIQNPPLLILDEATSHLDSDSEELVYQGMRRLAGGRTTLMIVHHLRLAAEADRILLLHRGKISEQGSHRQLLQQQGRYARMWRIQQLENDASAPV